MIFSSQSLDCRDVLSLPLNMEKLIGELRKVVGDQPLAGSNDNPVYVSFHQKKTMLKKRSTLGIGSLLETTVLALLCKGNTPCIAVPDAFDYQDALSSWKMASTCLLDDPACLKVIDECWMQGQENNDREMAPYIILYMKREGGGFELLDHQCNPNKPGMVQMGAKGKRLPFDIKSHNTDQNSLSHHIANSPSFLVEFQTLLDIYHPPQSLDKVSGSEAFCPLYKKICSELPISYQFPTIGIVNKLLPKPNNLGSNGELVHLHEDKAHIRFSHHGQCPAIPTQEEVFDILLSLSEYTTANSQESIPKKDC